MSLGVVQVSDLLIKNGMPFTYIHEGYHALKLRHADILIENGIITKIAANITADCQTLDATDCMLLPGYVNAGADLIDSAVLAGLLPDIAALRQYERIEGVKKIAYEMLGDDELEAIALCSLWENMRSGTTTIVDLCEPKAHKAVKVAAEKLGVRLLTTPANGVNYICAPCDIHAESDSGELVGAAVCGHIEPSNADKELMHAASATAVLSAVACAQTGEKFPAVNYLRGGVNVALATGIYGNSMQSEMRTAAFAAKQAEQNARQYKATDTFYAATVAGAQLIKMDNLLGRIDIGMAGDIAVVSLERLGALSYPFIQYLYGAEPADVKNIVCGGKVCMENGIPKKSAELVLARKKAKQAVLAVWERARIEVL